MSRIRPTGIWTTQAVIAMPSGDPTCDTCAGHGRIEVTGPRDHRVCPMCRGTGVTPAPRQVVRARLRQIAREARA
jgi:DnaJ-class molecular chaperone